MKKVLLIDGYNVIRRTGAFSRQLDHSLEDARASFVGVVRDFAVSRKVYDEVIVVFDGSRSGGFADSYRVPPVKVVFSRRGESADDEIKNILRVKRPGYSVEVVSDDNHVTNNARAHGADATCCRVFFLRISQRERARKRHRSSDGEEKSYDSAFVKAITDELKKIWVRP